MTKRYIVAMSTLALCVLAFYIYRPYSFTTVEHSADNIVTPTSTIEKKTIYLNFVGDILAARAIELTMRKQGYDYPLAKIAEKLGDADITFANLETPLVGTSETGKTTPGGTTVFRGDIAFADALQRAGIDIVSLANNHMKDQGQKGLMSTLETLDTVGLKHVGAGENLQEARKLAVIDVQGVKIGYLAYNDADVVPISYHATEVQSGTNIMDIQRLQEDIVSARPLVDMLVISMHSGTEYITTHPNGRQTQFGRAAIDAGADVVIGHHPHVLQPLEIYKGKYIFYSLGNFVFDQPWPDTKESALLQLQVSLTRPSGQLSEQPTRWTISTYTPIITPLVIQNFQPQETADISKQKIILDRFTKSEAVLSVGGYNIFVELATSSEDRVRGLSNRKSLPKNTGLLFVFDTEEKHGIWMKDMLFPIDIYWFDKDFKLVDTRLSVATSTYPDVFYPAESALYVLETEQGILPPMSLTSNLTGELTLVQSYDKR